MTLTPLADRPVTFRSSLPKCWRRFRPRRARWSSTAHSAPAATPKPFWRGAPRLSRSTAIRMRLLPVVFSSNNRAAGSGSSRRRSRHWTSMSKALTASCSTSASPPCRSIRRSAVFRSVPTDRSICAWRRLASAPPMSSTLLRWAILPGSSGFLAKSAMPAASPA